MRNTFKYLSIEHLFYLHLFESFNNSLNLEMLEAFLIFSSIEFQALTPANLLLNFP